MDSPIQNQSVAQQNTPLKQNNTWISYSIFGLIGLGVLIFLLEFFNITNIPFLSFLPHREQMIHPEDKIAQVGKETLYGSDLLNKKEFFSTVENQAVLQSAVQLKTAYLPLLIQESITLQAGEKAGWIQINQNVFNTMNKDWKQREKLLQIVSNIVNEKRNETMWEAVQVAFSGTFDQSTVAQKQQKKDAALKKIQEIKTKMDTQKLSLDDIHNQITKGTIATGSSSMRVYADSYTTNDLGWGINITKDTFEKIETIPLNTFSTIIEITMINKFQPNNDLVAYAIARKTVKNNNTWNDLRDWYSKAKPNYGITYY